jgi:hypothetical protein
VWEEVEDYETLLFTKEKGCGVCMWLEGLYGIIACEALVQLWFHAAPLQGIRRFVVKITPFLYSKDQETHLFDCKYCVSFWAAIVVTVVLFTPFYVYFVLPLVIHRMSNFLHLFFSLMRDRQFDLRVGRKL